MDSIEEQTMSYADVLVVNSNFTKSQVQRVFASLADHEVRVLYPALDMEKFAQPVFDDKTPMGPIVSLNRFERKKNIKLVLRAYAMLLQRTKKAPPLVIAGGYDVRNVENVEYLQELKGLASELDISSSVRFRPSISDEERATLMQAALCIVYTPHLEHFGIVPLEAMYAGRPVIAVNSGGPMETIIHEKTGFLCDGTPSTFCDALLSLVKNYPELSTTMGKAGHEHVKAKFGLERFQKQWVQLVDDTIETGKTRRMNQRGGYMVWRSFYYLFDALLTFGGALLLTYALRLVGILEPKQNIIGKLKSLRADWDDAL
jgi:glycosyltransferase involved in cell wall biosynthesis